MLFAAIALSGPRWGTERSVVQSSGVDVVLAPAKLAGVSQPAGPVPSSQRHDDAEET